MMKVAKKLSERARKLDPKIATKSHRTHKRNVALKLVRGRLRFTGFTDAVREFLEDADYTESPFSTGVP
jgi:hypothetical protein